MKYVQTLILIAILSSCGTYHHGNFNKQKFTNLKSIDAQSNTQAEKNVALKSSDNVIQAENPESSLNSDLLESSENTEIAENVQDKTLTTKQIVSTKVKEVKTRIIQKTIQVKELLSIKRIQKKYAKNEAAMAAGIIAGIIFLSLAAISGLFAFLFLELGFSGIFWGATAGICLILGILFLILGLTAGK